MKLNGKTVLLFRASNEVGNIEKKLLAQGAQLAHFPLISFAPPSDHYAALDHALQEIDSFDWILFTSQHAVKVFFSRQNSPEPTFLKARVAAVGEATCALLQQLGVQNVETAAEESAAGLLKHLQHFDMQGKNILFPRAQMGQQILVEGLTVCGADVIFVEAYQTVLPENLDREEFTELLQSKKIDVLFFASPSQVQNYLQLCHELQIATAVWQLPALCIGKTTADEARPHFPHVEVFE